MSAKEDLRAEHKGTYFGDPFPYCDACGEETPCSVIQVLDEEEQRAEGYRKAAIILRDLWRDAASWDPSLRRARWVRGLAQFRRHR